MIINVLALFISRINPVVCIDDTEITSAYLLCLGTDADVGGYTLATQIRILKTISP